MYEIKNVALDYRYEMARRVAPLLEMEPTIAGKRIRLRCSEKITNEQFEHNKDRIAIYVKQGVIVVNQILGPLDTPGTEITLAPPVITDQPVITELLVEPMKQPQAAESETPETPHRRTLLRDTACAHVCSTAFPRNSIGRVNGIGGSARFQGHPPLRRTA
jgi:hypothetical protein